MANYNLTAQIDSYLREQCGYEAGDTADFDFNRGIMPTPLVAFITENQTKTLADIESNMVNNSTRSVILDSLHTTISPGREAIFKVFKDGFECQGKTLRVADMRHACIANRFTIIKNLKHSNSDQAYIDILVCINGLPVFSIIGGESSGEAIKHYQSVDPQNPFFSFNSRMLAHFAVGEEEVQIAKQLKGKETEFAPFTPHDSEQIETVSSYLWEKFLLKASVLAAIRDPVRIGDVVREEEEATLHLDMRASKDQQPNFEQYLPPEQVAKDPPVFQDEQDEIAETIGEDASQFGRAERDETLISPLPSSPQVDNLERAKSVSPILTTSAEVAQEKLDIDTTKKHMSSPLVVDNQEQDNSEAEKQLLISTDTDDSSFCNNADLEKTVTDTSSTQVSSFFGMDTESTTISRFVDSNENESKSIEKLSARALGKKVTSEELFALSPLASLEEHPHLYTALQNIKGGEKYHVSMENLVRLSRDTVHTDSDEDRHKIWYVSRLQKLIINTLDFIYITESTGKQATDIVPAKNEQFFTQLTGIDKDNFVELCHKGFINEHELSLIIDQFKQWENSSLKPEEYIFHHFDKVEMVA